MVHGDIYVAERFIGWQEKVLLSLQSSFDAKTKVGVGREWVVVRLERRH